MLHELYNWLLLMDLKAKTVWLKNRPSGLCREEFWVGFVIPQAFPQEGGFENESLANLSL